jgi:hypothetical protein
MQIIIQNTVLWCLWNVQVKLIFDRKIWLEQSRIYRISRQNALYLCLKLVGYIEVRYIKFLGRKSHFKLGFLSTCMCMLSPFSAPCQNVWKFTIYHCSNLHEHTSTILVKLCFLRVKQWIVYMHTGK